MLRRRCGRGSRAKVTAVVLCLGLVVAAPAVAADFEWSAPPGCPAEPEVRARVERELDSRLAALPDIAFVAQARAAGRGYELVLTARKEGAVLERRIAAGTCSELVDVLVAAMSLAIDSLEAEEPAEPSPPATVDAEQPVRVSEAAGPRPTKPASRRATPTPEPGSPVDLVGWAHVGALLEVGSLPGPALGVEAGAVAGTERLRGRVSGLLVPKQRFELEGTAQGDFDLMALGAGLCYVLGEPSTELLGCIQGEIGRLRGEGVQVIHPRRDSSIWVAVAPELWLLARPTSRGWGAFARVGVPLPVYRQPFELTELGPVHTPALPGLRAAVGLEVDLW